MDEHYKMTEMQLQMGNLNLEAQYLDRITWIGGFFNPFKSESKRMKRGISFLGQTL